IDGDGRLDMYVANYRAYNLDDSLPPQSRAFNQMVREVSKGKYEIVPEFRNEYKLVERPDMGGLRMSVRGAPDELYRNEGGRFVQAPVSQRFIDATGKPLASDPESFTLDAKLVDLNGDGAPDLYVSNDFEDMDMLWFNDGHGNFRLADWRSLRQMSNSSMGVDVADVNGDGLPDIFVDDMQANDSHRHKTQIPTHTAFPKKPGDIETQLQQQRNVLFVNRGDGTFAEISQAAGVQATGWSWGAMFLDVDLDGFQDILIANGHLWDIMDADVQEGLQNRLNGIDWRRLRWQFPKLPLKNVAYRNRGDLSFEEVGEKWKFGASADVSHAIAAADLDGDGDLDVVVNRLDAPALVLRNDASAPRVAVRLIGDAPNTRAVGAKITLTNGAVPLQTREVTAGGLYMSHSDYEQSFAMGKSTDATLTVDWRDGRRTTINNVRPNRLYEVGMSTAVARPTVDSSAISQPLFEDATAQLGGHTHTEDTFDDWDKQFLLPDALSQGGPGIAWFDLDRDGAEDLLVGTGKGGRIAVFHNEHGKLVARPTQGPIAPVDVTTLLGYMNNGAPKLLAGMSSWELRSLAELTSQPSVVGIDVTRGSLDAKMNPIVGSHESATGPLALGDYDGDGALDLFVGARAIPMRYPTASSSGLFHSRNGRFVLDTTNSALLHNIGMVSSATFADITGDGFPDLVLARDWGSLVLLINDGKGHFSIAPPSWGLDQLTSRWNGVTVGDIDGDGRLDIIATSWGRNTDYHPTAEHPLKLYYGPFGTDGAEEMLVAQYDARINAEAPLNSYARVRVAMKDVVNRVRTFAEYADAPIAKVLGAFTSQQLSAVTFDHTVFLNRGNHFEARSLPAEAQWAPASYVGVADFDGDGNEDVFLSQNFYPTGVGSPRYDAGRGLLLLGDGKGGLRPVSGKQSGIEVYGDQRGAAYADFDGDGRLDLVVSQNGAATRLFHNRGAKPSLRVRVRGQASNPDGVGAQIRIEYGNRMGPVREITAGSGYWSQNGAVQLFGLSATPTAVQVRWPGGGESRVPVSVGAREVMVSRTP
ncbi:MAG: FG-GAP-like repeat-containing protein, partial [bacterium]